MKFSEIINPTTDVLECSEMSFLDSVAVSLQFFKFHILTHKTT